MPCWMQRLGSNQRALGSRPSCLPTSILCMATQTGFEPTTSASTGRRTTVVLLGLGTGGRIRTFSGLGFEASASTVSPHPYGSDGWGRTSNLAVNSRTRYHCATSEWRRGHGFEPALHHCLHAFKTCCHTNGGLSAWRSEWDLNPRTFSRLRLSGALHYHSATAPGLPILFLTFRGHNRQSWWR